MALRPLYAKLVVLRKEESDTTEGGIVLPDSAKKVLDRGTVVKAGPGRQNSAGKYFPLSVKDGDTILFEKYAGDEITEDGTTYLILSEADVFGILEE